MPGCSLHPARTHTAWGTKQSSKCQLLQRQHQQTLQQQQQPRQLHGLAFSVASSSKPTSAQAEERQGAKRVSARGPPPRPPACSSVPMLQEAALAVLQVPCFRLARPCSRPALQERPQHSQVLAPPRHHQPCHQAVPCLWIPTFKQHSQQLSQPCQWTLRQPLPAQQL